MRTCVKGSSFTLDYATLPFRVARNTAALISAGQSKCRPLSPRYNRKTAHAYSSRSAPELEPKALQTNAALDNLARKYAERRRIIQRERPPAPASTRRPVGRSPKTIQYRISKDEASGNLLKRRLPYTPQTTEPRITSLAGDEKRELGDRGKPRSPLRTQETEDRRRDFVTKGYRTVLSLGGLQKSTSRTLRSGAINKHIFREASSPYQTTPSKPGREDRSHPTSLSESTTARQRRRIQRARRFDAAKAASVPQIPEEDSQREGNGKAKIQDALMNHTATAAKPLSRDILDIDVDNLHHVSQVPQVSPQCPGTIERDSSVNIKSKEKETAEENKGFTERIERINCSTMSSHIRIITTPTADTPGTLLELFFNNKRYLIGQIHEGAQRAFIQNSAKFAKFSDIFVTGRTEWANAGGLLGVMLTMADVISGSVASVKADLKKKVEKGEAELANLKQKDLGDSEGRKAKNAKEIIEKLYKQLAENRSKLRNNENPHIRVHGSANLTYLFATSRRFVLRNSMHVEVLEHYHRPSHDVSADRPADWADDHVRVWTLPVDPKIPAPPKSAQNRHSAEYALRFDNVDDGGYKDDYTDEFAEMEQTRQTSAEVVDQVFNSGWSKWQVEQKFLSEVHDGTTIFLENADEVTRTEAKSFTGEENPKVWVRKPWPGNRDMSLMGVKLRKIAMSYIFKTHPQRGAFRQKEAERLGVEKGPDYRLLTTGESVQTKEGNIVTPEMVMEKDQPGRGVAIIDIPSKEYVAALVKRPEWNSSLCADLDAFIWLLGPGIYQDKRIKQMMRDHGEVQHIVSSPETSFNYLAMEKAASSAFRLNHLDPMHYPAPRHEIWREGSYEQHVFGTNDPHVQLARRGLRLHLQPPKGLDRTEILPPLGKSTALAEIPESASSMANAATDAIASTKSSETGLPGAEAEISFLGTGSATPSLHRNVAGTLLRVPGVGNYLFDCGEGSLGQLKRMFTPRELSQIFQDLKMIWISHMHADHHLGITSVIRAWCEEVHGSSAPKVESLKLQKRLAHWDSGRSFSQTLQQVMAKRWLCINGDAGIAPWLAEWSRAEDFGFQETLPLRLWVPQSVDGEPPENPMFFHYLNKCVLDEFGNQTSESAIPVQIPESKSLFAKLGVTDIQACYVHHTRGANAVSLTFPNGFKFSYSGDCRPSERFAEIGKDSTVLVHEATFDDDMQEDAIRKRHSTTSEAIEVGLAMKAKRIMLTHFSQRYQKLPVIPDQVSGGTAVAVEKTKVINPVGSSKAGPISGIETVPDLISTNGDFEHAPGIKKVKAIEQKGDPRMQNTSSSNLDSRDEAQDEASALANSEMIADGDSESNNTRPISSGVTSTEIPSLVTGDRDEAFAQEDDSRTQLQEPEASQPALEPPTYGGDKEGQTTKSIPVIPDDVKIGVAFDYMRVKVKDIEHLHHYYPAIQALFAEPENGEPPLTNEEINRGRKKGGKTKADASSSVHKSKDATVLVSTSDPPPEEDSQPAYPAFTPQEVTIASPSPERLPKRKSIKRKSIEDPPKLTEMPPPLPAYPNYLPSTPNLHTPEARGLMDANPQSFPDMFASAPVDNKSLDADVDPLNANNAAKAETEERAPDPSGMQIDQKILIDSGTVIDEPSVPYGEDTATGTKNSFKIRRVFSQAADKPLAQTSEEHIENGEVED